MDNSLTTKTCKRLPYLNYENLFSRLIALGPRQEAHIWWKHRLKTRFREDNILTTSCKATTWRKPLTRERKQIYIKPSESPTHSADDEATNVLDQRYPGRQTHLHDYVLHTRASVYVPIPVQLIQ
ncbi:hypothetical protein VTJ04DRAFT_6514 [Mycothermus thermophilus]|uniref:uncharacterized protein n=1 Tax=Humicola insolens TaxID=85995 RepID=UPI0037434675